MRRSTSEYGECLLTCVRHQGAGIPLPAPFRPPTSILFTSPFGAFLPSMLYRHFSESPIELGQCARKTPLSYLERLRAGELDAAQKQKKLLDAYAEELSVKRLEWQNIQVSVVAGARLEPALTPGCHWLLSLPPIRTPQSTFSICSSQTTFTSSSKRAVRSPSQTSASSLISKCFEYRAFT
jgi:hypothetical protein